MKGQLAFEAIGALSDDLILESAEALGFMENSPAAAPRHRRESTLSRFFSSGWGVAMICAVVSLSVWAVSCGQDRDLSQGPMAPPPRVKPRS